MTKDNSSAEYYKMYYALSDIHKYLVLLAKENNIPINQLLFCIAKNSAIEIYLIDDAETTVISYVAYVTINEIITKLQG